jgi:ComF family protein
VAFLCFRPQPTWQVLRNHATPYLDSVCGSLPQKTSNVQKSIDFLRVVEQDWASMSFPGACRYFFRLLLDVVFPESCLLCGGDFSPGEKRRGPVCSECTAGLVPLTGPRCVVCGIPLISEIERCTRCRGHVFDFDGHASLFEYRAEIRELLYYYKFKGRAAVGDFFAQLLQRERPWPGTPEVIVPVPTSRKSVRARGFGHTERIARQVSRLSGIASGFYLRQMAGRPQKSLDLAQRQANLRGRIGIEEKGRAELHGRRVLLLDDVFTTGATVSECARVLKAHGAVHVFAVTLAMDV